MKTLKTLIRLQKQKVDELRRRIGQFENDKQLLLQKSKKLDAELKREFEIAGKQMDMSGFFGNFAERVRNRQSQIANDVAKLDKQIEKIRAEVRIAFSDLKKYEVLRDRKIAEMKEAEARREVVEMDEIAAQQFERRKALSDAEGEG